MEGLQSVEAHRYDVVGEIQEAEVEDDELVAILPLAIEMSRPAAHKTCFMKWWKSLSVLEVQLELFD